MTDETRWALRGLRDDTPVETWPAQVMPRGGEGVLVLRLQDDGALRVWESGPCPASTVALVRDAAQARTFLVIRFPPRED